VARRIFEFDPPERFVADAVGEPGDRTFFLQASDGERVVSVALEKTQVAALAERMDALVTELTRRGLAEEGEPTLDLRPLAEPVDELFRVGALTLGWDGERSVVLVEARETTDDDEAAAELPDQDPDGPDLVRVRISVADARAFVERAVRAVSAGRPPCPFCGQPIERTGHLCPRRNGHGSLVN
jgi:uncharacterized repeat protein (TIGR03847 family)